MGAYLVRRLLWAFPVLLVVSMIVFTILRLAPGDPVDTLLGQRYDPETAAQLQAKYGYDKPLYVQYVKYMSNLAKGDLGVSTRHQDFTVKDVVVPKIWISTKLGFFALIIAFSLGIPIGLYAALARGTFMDPLIIGFWLLLDAVPAFVLTTFTAWFFALKLDLVSVAWRGILSPNAILPILIMSLPAVAGIARFMRASVISVLGEDYIRTARAKGLKERTVIISHIGRNAMLPLVTVIGLSLPGITAGSFFVETFFGIPGIAAESLAAALTPDFDIILGLVLFGSTLFVLANVVIDVMYAYIDPRIRVTGRRG